MVGGLGTVGGPAHLPALGPLCFNNFTEMPLRASWPWSYRSTELTFHPTAGRLIQSYIRVDNCEYPAWNIALFYRYFFLFSVREIQNREVVKRRKKKWQGTPYLLERPDWPTQVGMVWGGVAFWIWNHSPPEGEVSGSWMLLSDRWAPLLQQLVDISDGLITDSS